MKGSKKLWFLWDLNQQRAMGPYAEPELMAILGFLGRDNLDHLLVWTPGWETWSGFRAPGFEKFLNSLSSVKEPTECPAVPEKLMRDYLLKQVNIHEQKSLNLRKTERFFVEVPCVISVNESDFKTKTQDVSEGGLRVADSVPDWVGGYCLISLAISENQTISLLASLAEDQQQEKTRFQVQSVDHPQYREWIEALRKASAA